MKHKVSYTQDNRRIGVATPLGTDVLLLSSFQGEEGISRLFHFDLELLSENESIDFDAMVGKNVTIWITLADGNERYINGQVSRFSQGGRDANFTSYHAEVVPWLWFLTRTSDCRIFQKKKAPDIIQKIFTDFGFKDYALRLYGSFVEREYCVQYRETAFNFVSRLMEEEGIFYFFEHENGKHTLVLTNSPTEHKPCPHQATVRYEKSAGGWQDNDVILEWRLQQELRSGKYTLDDYDFENPATDLTVNVSGKGTYELYDYPGEYTKRAAGDDLVRVRLQETETPYQVGYGSSDCRAFTSGYKFNLTDHYRGNQNQAYALTLVRHAASQGGDFRSRSMATNDEEFNYRNNFECIPGSTPFRPGRLTPEPVVQGAQTAVVVGPSGEEIFTDKYGRIKVQFHWDREGKLDENSSCWIRVSQLWAGKKWGSVYTPRVGQEVIVDFLEGDPDRPIVTGRVYNGEQLPPYDLPGEKTKSTIKTYSSKGGGGFNEIRFEDKKGSEQIFIHGEKNLDVRIKKDVFETFGNDTHLIVDTDQFEQVKGDKHQYVKGDMNEKVDGTKSLTAGLDHEEKVGMNFALEAGTEIYLKAGANLVIESGISLTLKVGGNFINLNPGGVFISGTMVMINSGGAAGSGAGASPQTPQAPQEADKADPGQASTLPAPPKVPVRPKFSSAAAMVMKQAALTGAPFCDI
jgi:type VI secretion system secreted protein VgrG